MNNKNKGFIEEGVIIMLGLFALVGFIALIADLSLTIKNGIGWVWQERHGTAVKEFIKEENGCVYFIDIFGHNIKTCGEYQIDKF